MYLATLGRKIGIKYLFHRNSRRGRGRGCPQKSTLEKQKTFKSENRCFSSPDRLVNRRTLNVR